MPKRIKPENALLLIGFALMTLQPVRLFAQNGVGVNTNSPLSSLDINGSFGKKVSIVSSSITLDETYSSIVADNGATAITLTLPAANTCSGRIYDFKRSNTSTTNVTIAGTIDGATNYILSLANQSVCIFSDGTNWRSTTVSSPSAWSLTGNSGTTPGTNFLGTTDAKDLVFKTNSTEEARLTTATGNTGYFGVGTTTPSTYGRISLLSNGEGKNREDDLGIASFNTLPSPSLLFFSANGTESSPVNCVNGDDIISIIGKAQINGSMKTSSYINSNYLGDGTTNLSDLLFFTSGSTNSNMAISQNGYVGINNTPTPASTLEVNGSVAANVNTTSANLTLDATHHIVIITSGTPSITLPAANTCSKRIYHITNTTATARTISSYNDLSNTAVTSIAANTPISIVSDGTTWRRFR